jgi:hypothetical protein
MDKGLIFDDTFDNAATAIAHNLPNTGLEASIHLTNGLSQVAKRITESLETVHVQKIGLDSATELSNGIKQIGVEAAREISKGLRNTALIICVSAVLMRYIGKR